MPAARHAAGGLDGQAGSIRPRPTPSLLEQAVADALVLRPATRSRKEVSSAHRRSVPRYRTRRAARACWPDRSPRSTMPPPGPNPLKRPHAHAPIHPQWVPNARRLFRRPAQGVPIRAAPGRRAATSSPDRPDRPRRSAGRRIFQERRAFASLRQPLTSTATPGTSSRRNADGGSLAFPPASPPR